jgi:hypothetical protein
MGSLTFLKKGETLGGILLQGFEIHLFWLSFIFPLFLLISYNQQKLSMFNVFSKKKKKKESCVKERIIDLSISTREIIETYLTLICRSELERAK